MGCISTFNHGKLCFVAGKLRKEVQRQIGRDTIGEQAAVVGHAATEGIGTVFHRFEYCASGAGPALS
jgi:hypothetical protein